MKFIQEKDRRQAYIFPTSLEEAIYKINPKTQIIFEQSRNSFIFDKNLIG